MSSDSDHIYTYKEFIAYGDRLHINTAVDIVINGLAVYIVIRHSTKAMETYKSYILLTLFCAFAMDFHLTFIFGPFIMLPSTIMCGAGIIARYTDPLWGEIVPYCLLCVAVSAVGLSIIYGLLYQYFSLSGKAQYFQGYWLIIAFVLIIIIYPSPAILIICFTTDIEASKVHVSKVFPYSYDLYISAPCFTVILNQGGKEHYCTLIILIALAAGFAYGIAFKINKKLREMSNVLSAATLKARKQFLVALCLQLTVPSLLIIIPLGILLGSVLADSRNMSALSNYVMPIMALHSSANALTVLLVITPYRQTLLRWVSVVTPFQLKLSPTTTAKVTEVSRSMTAHHHLKKNKIQPVIQKF